ncbi:MAG: hypothetical protein QXK37_03895 [Candidatus Woesearchaeota archaeon]
MKQTSNISIISLRFVILSLFLGVFIALVAAESSVIPEWYKVEPWEIEVCTKWGGTSKVQETYAQSKGESHLLINTVTLQARRTPFSAGKQEKYIYELAWYIGPMLATLKYDVTLVKEGGEKRTVYKGAAPPSIGDANYYAEENTEKYTTAVINYGVGTLTVPIVETRG